MRRITRWHALAAAALALGGFAAFDRPAAATADASGRWIVFARQTGTGVSALHGVLPDGRGLRKMSDNRSFDPVYTPDGARIVFASTRGGRDGAPELYVRTRTGALTRLTRTPAPTATSHHASYDPTVSPDGKRVVFVREVMADGQTRVDLYSVRITGGDERRITNTPRHESSPTFAANGSSIYFAADDGWIYQLYAGNTKRVAPGAQPAKSPDARGLLAFVRDGGVYVTWDGKATRVGSGATPAWAPDGDRLVYAGVEGLHVVDHDGRNRRRITTPPEVVHDVNPTWQPRTPPPLRALAAAIPRQELAFKKGNDVYAIGADGSGLRKIARGGAPSWSPDGSKLVLANRDWLHVVGGDGKDLRRLTPAGRGFGPAWSPDGKLIAFTSRRSGQFAVYATRPDGTGVRRLTRSVGRAEEATSPAWSPDAKWLAFVSNRGNVFNPEIYVSRLDGTGLRRLTHTVGGDAVLGDDDVPHWSPDGRRIVFSSNRTRDGAIWIMRRDGSGERKLIDYRGTDEWLPRFSPDGKRVSFTREYGAGPAGWRREVWIANADGTGARKLTDGSDASWRPQ